MNMPKTLPELQKLEDRLTQELDFLRNSFDHFLDFYNAKTITLEQLETDMKDAIKAKSLAENQLEEVRRYSKDAYLQMEMSKIRRGW